MRAKPHRSFFRSVTGAIVLALFVAGIAAQPAGAARTPKTQPGSEYLSLGDSIAFGFQNRILDKQIAAGNFDPSDFDHGYTDALARKLHKLNRGLHTTNLSCPGESTDSFLAACGYPFPLHTHYTGSQLDAALAIIAQHPGAVGTITLTLGGNDLFAAQEDCGGDAACVRRALTHIGENLTTIVRALRNAAPDAVIVLLQLYNPLAVDDPSTNADAVALNDVIATAAKTVDAKLADAFTPFNVSGNQPRPLCRLTLWCHEQDSHPTNDGYRLLGRLFFDATGYHK